MFHQINSNVHNNSINNSNHHNNNLFEEEYSHTVHTACALKYCRVFVSVCLYVCVWVCVTLRKNIFQQISIFLVGAAFTGFLEKSEWEPRENNIRPRKDRERVYFSNRPAFLFHPHDFLPFYDDDLNKHQTERRERREDASKFFQTLPFFFFFFFFLFLFLFLSFFLLLLLLLLLL